MIVVTMHYYSFWVVSVAAAYKLCLFSVKLLHCMLPVFSLPALANLLYITAIEGEGDLYTCTLATKLE